MELFILAIFLVKIDVSYGYETQIDPNCECGVPNMDVTSRIVGGSIADAHRYPWMTVLLSQESLCGGVLINDRYILTAGHCVGPSSSGVQVVALGMQSLRNPHEGEVIRGVESRLHPNYTYGTVRDLNDIALIKLPKPIDYTRNIRPVCLPKQDRNYTGLKVQITGWGMESEDGNPSVDLKETTVEVISLEECANTKLGSYINENMLCTYSNGTDACQGDSGGPLLLERQKDKYEAIGIVSWGFGCAEKDNPGVYTKVVDYLDWILSKTQDSIYCKNE